MTDDPTRRLAEQNLRGVKELHKEQNPGALLSPSTPIAPHAAAERIGISPVGHWYATALEYLEEEGALEPSVIMGGRSGSYERSLRQARETAIEEMVAEAEQMGADAVVGIDVDYESIHLGRVAACSCLAPRVPP